MIQEAHQAMLLALKELVELADIANNAPAPRLLQELPVERILAAHGAARQAIILAETVTWPRGH